MAAVPIKFRCYRCSQLLGVARSKAGAVVACPKCSAELVVPEPSEPARALSSGGVGDSRANALDSGGALDFLDIRPEDIRVEPGIAVGFRVGPATETETETETDALEAVADDEPAAFTFEPPPSAVSSTDLPHSMPSPTPDEPTAAEQDVPIIRLDRPRKSSAAQGPTSPTTRARDLVLPRSVVAAWSLFVLFALAFAFLTGLLAGHFIWRVH